MATNYSLHDGYKDMFNGDSITFHPRSEFNAVRIKPKNPGQTFTIPNAFVSLLDAVDFGTENGFHHSPIVASAISGELVTLYFTSRTTATGPANSNWGLLLSQVDTLLDPFPPLIYVGHTSTVFSNNFVIDSVNFKAPNGILSYCDYVPTFRGSTFKVAPRIFSEIYLETAVQWPPAGRWETASHPLWHPFDACPNLESIEYQGDLGPYCEQILPSNFVYIDENGDERVDAYPSGGRPKVINQAVGPLTSFNMQSGSSFPQYDLSQLEICIAPVVATEVRLPNTNGMISLPIGPAVQNAPNLKFYSNGIKKIARGKDYDDPNYDQQVPLIFGLKLLGIDLPDGVERAVDAHELYRHHKYFQDDDAWIGIAATPEVVKTTFNFSFGQALESFWGSADESLLIPRAPSSLTYINRYASVELDEDYSYNLTPSNNYCIQLKPGGILEGLEIPKMEANSNLISLDGYMENTFSYAKTGPLSFSVLGGESYSGRVSYHIPAPSVNSGMLLRNYARYTASYLTGETEEIENTTGSSLTQLAFGGFSGTTPRIRVILNVDSDWFSGSSSLRAELEGLISPATYSELSFIAGGGQTEQAPVKIRLSKNDFTIESFDTTSIGYAVSFQDGTFHRAEIDPTTIDNPIIPLYSTSTKIDGAYRYCLSIATPLHPTIKYADQISMNEPAQTIGGASYIPSYTMIMSYGIDQDIAQQYTYHLSDINIPVFSLPNESDKAYDTWSNIFSYLIYGDLDSFKSARNINASIGGSPSQPTVASGDALGLGVLNWTIRQVGTRQVINLQAAPGGTGSRGFGVGLFREEIPYYPGEPPLNGDPIFIDFTRVGSNYTFDGVNVPTFRNAVRPQTQPI